MIEAIQRYLLTMNSNAHGSFSFSARTDEATYEAREALADFLNVSRPSMSRELGRMKEEGLIDFYRSSFTIKNLEALKLARG